MTSVTLIAPTINTERLILRPVQLKDAEQYEEEFVNYNVVKTLAATVPWPYPRGGVKTFFENVIFPKLNKDIWLWVILEKNKPDKIIGGIELRRKTEPDNRGFWLGESYWGKGYMTEAAKAVNHFAFQSVGMKKMTFTNAVGNAGSSNIKKSSGARLVKVEPCDFVSDEYTEKEVWELTKEDWLKQQ